MANLYRVTVHRRSGNGRPATFAADFIVAARGEGTAVSRVLEEFEVPGFHYATTKLLKHGHDGHAVPLGDSWDLVTYGGAHVSELGDYGPPPERIKQADGTDPEDCSTGPDLEVDRGPALATLTVIRGVSDRGVEWLAKNVERPYLFNVAADHRAAEDIISAATDDGLWVVPAKGENR